VPPFECDLIEVADLRGDGLAGGVLNSANILDYFSMKEYPTQVENCAHADFHHASQHFASITALNQPIGDVK